MRTRCSEEINLETKFMERSRKGQATKVMVILCVRMFIQSMIIYPKQGGNGDITEGLDSSFRIHMTNTQKIG
jgi:hypothetical protein